MKLLIAEKPSVANDIAKVIGAAHKEKGYLTGEDYIVSWCFGHLIALAEPEEYSENLKKWSLDTLPIIPAQYKTVVSKSTASQFYILKELMQREDVTELICATDAGREGELIFRLVYEKAGCRKPFKRLWISSMEEKSILDGLQAMKDSREYDNLYQAALCRQRADWLVGMNLSRLYSVMYNKKLIAGRVQTPTVNLIVKRQQEINQFVPQTYYNLVADCGSFTAHARAESKAAAQSIIDRCNGKEAYVAKVDKQEKKENPAALYDLTSLQREGNRYFSYSAQQTLDYMQSLYEKKLATYPRTDSRYITADQEQSVHSLIEKLLNAELFTGEIFQGYDMEKVQLQKIINDKKVSDHHAILPTKAVSRETLDSLPTGEKNILILIIFRLLSAPYAPHRYTATKVLLDIEGEGFTATGKEILDNGYKAIEEQLKQFIKSAPDEKQEENTILPPMAEGNTFSVKSLSAEEKKTQPPKPYTEDTLLSAMETAGKNIANEELKEAMKDSGLGTPATRAGIIENIISIGYVKRDKKKLIPTETAFTFVELVAEKVKEPELTAEWEKQLSDIQSGTIQTDTFMDGITGFITETVTGSKLLYNPEENRQTFKTEREVIGICPRCGKHVVEYPKSFSCESGKDGCGFAIWKEDRFFKDKKKSMTKALAAKLLKSGQVEMTGLYSSKTGKTYDAAVILVDTGKYVNFKLEFKNKGEK